MSDALVLSLFALFLLAVLLLAQERTRRRRKRPRGRGRAAGGRPMAVVDGSNVMFWNGNTPALESVAAVLDLLDSRGWHAGVIFDANVGWRLEGRYLGDAALRTRLGLKGDRVMVVPRGQQADPFLLNFARQSQAIVISNDRFRDRIADYPDLAVPGRLVRGGWRDGAPWLDLPDPARRERL